jgi:molecular chaperone DnaJ
MSTKRDYYEILGLTKNASLDEIKRAYRQMALRYHPDRVSSEQKKEAEEKFKEISEAYAVLSDSQKRALYDQYGHSGIDQRFTYEDIFKGADFSSIFGDMSDFGFGGSLFEGIFGDLGFDLFGGGRRRGRSRRKGRDIQFEIDVTLEEAAFGAEKSIEIPRYEACSFCQGSGVKPGAKKATCSQCRGNGQIRMSQGFFQIAQTCPTCRGEGSVITNPCQKCNGEGRVKVRRKLKVKIPPGVDRGAHLRMRGEGEAGTQGKGDLYLIININPHPVFERHNNDLYIKLDLNLTKAILGGEVGVPTLNGKVEMRIPAGTQSGKVFRLKGKGIVDLHGRGKGDELVLIRVKIPTNLSTEQKRLIQEFAKISGEDSESKEKITDKIKRAFK